MPTTDRERRGEEKAEALNYLIAASSDLLELPNESNERREGNLSRNWISFRSKWKRVGII